MNRPAALLAMLVLAAACGGVPSQPEPAAESAAPAATPSAPHLDVLAATVTVSGTANTFQGGDDHMGIYVVNHGRRIEKLVIWAPAWLEEHSFAMGSSRLCDQDATEQYIECGPVEAGASTGYSLRSLPNAPGDFEFTFRPFERSASGLLPIPDAAGAPQLLVLRETVVPQTTQVPGWQPEPSPSPS